MALTGEAKAEWRRKNRERIRAQNIEWLAQRLLTDPEYLNRQREKTRAARPVRKCGCGATITDRSKYCSIACRPGYVKKGRKVDGWGGSMWKVVARMNSRTAHHSLTPINRMAANIARSLRLMIGRSTKGKPFPRVSVHQTWEQAAAKCVAQANHREASDWERKFGTISSSLNKRKDAHEQANQCNRHPQEAEGTEVPVCLHG